VAIGLIGVTVRSVIVGLAIGALPTRLDGLPRQTDRQALRLGIAAGLVGAAAAAVASALRDAAWAHVPDVGALAAIEPLLQTALTPVSSYMIQLAVVTATLTSLEWWTASWARRRVPAGLSLVAIGFLAAGSPAGSHLGGWAVAGAITGGALLLAYVTLLRFDLTMLPAALATMAAVRLLARAADRPYPGAIAGAVFGVLLVTALAATWFRALRRSTGSAVQPAV
jgi:hypothetical protein